MAGVSQTEQDIYYIYSNFKWFLADTASAKMAAMSHLEIMFPNSNFKMLLPIDLNFYRVVGHHLGLVAFEVGAIWRTKMDAILKFCFRTLIRRVFFGIVHHFICPLPTFRLAISGISMFLYWTDLGERPELCTCSV